MTDQQKFMEAYETLANLAKKNPLMPKLWTDAQINLLRQAKEVYFSLKNEGKNGELVAMEKLHNQEDNLECDKLIEQITAAIREVETTLQPIFKNIVALKADANYVETLKKLRDKIGWQQPEKEEQNAVFALCVQLQTEAQTANDEKYLAIAKQKFKSLEQVDRRIRDGIKLVEFNNDPSRPINAPNKKATKEAVSKTLEITYTKREAIQFQLDKFEKMPEAERAQYQAEINNLAETNNLLSNFLIEKQDFCNTDFTISSKPLEPKRDDIERKYAEWILVNKPAIAEKYRITKSTSFPKVVNAIQDTNPDFVFYEDDENSHYNKVREYVIKQNYGARFGMNGDTQKISIQIDTNGTKIEQEAATIHEMQHLIQAKKGELGFYADGQPASELYDIWDEVEAYKMQFAAVPESFAKYKHKIQNINEITPDWVKKHNSYYASLPSVKLNTGTLLSEVYPNLPDNIKKWYQKEKIVDEKGLLKAEYQGKSISNFCELLGIKTF